MEVNNIPIDIHYNKLLDWLINRRHCQQQWQSFAIIIREKINNAIQDMPAVEEITKLLSGTYINYFHCLRIVEILKETEANSKNIFGRYSSKRMKDWKEIIELYQKDDIYLAEVAQLLTRNVNYEITSLKKQIGKCKQTQDESVKKESEYLSLENEFKNKYKTACKQMGIAGDKVRAELVALIKDLPSDLERVTKSVKHLEPAIQYYQKYVEFTSGRCMDSEPVCEMLKYLVTKGNTTTYEWNTGAPPSRVEESRLDVAVEDDVEELNDEIDWGGGGDDEIDYGNLGSALDSITFEEGAVDFGDNVEIDWGDGNIDIEIEDGGETVVESQTNKEPGVARGDDALSVLDNKSTRDMVFDDLYELQWFIQQRISDMCGRSDTINEMVFDTAPDDIQIPVSMVQEMLKNIDEILATLNSTKIQHMLTIRSFPRYVDRLADGMKHHLSQSQKYYQMQHLMVVKRQEALAEQRKLEPKLALIKKKTKELKKKKVPTATLR